MSKPRLVIIGGGYAGLTLAHASSSFLDVTVIDMKDYFEWNIANVRGVVDTSLIDQVELPYSAFKGIGTFVQGTVVSFDNQDVKLAGGKSIPYDYLVIAVGATYSDALGKADAATITQRKEELKALAAKIRAAENILVVGGGPTGVELTAEILEAYPTKKVTLVNSAGQLLPGKSATMANRAKAFLEKAGAKLILGERVEKVAGSDTEFTTSSGTKLTAEAVFWTITGSPATGFLKETAPQLLNDKGQVKVDEFFFVEGHTNVFALGDVTSVQEWKQAYYAGEAAKVLSKNLQSLVKAGRNGKPKLKAWAPNGGMEAQFVSLGRKAGVGHLGGFNLPSFMVSMMKSKDLFVKQTRKGFGFPV